MPAQHNPDCCFCESMMRQLALLALLVQLASGVTYHLSHEREGNVFNLTCQIQDGPSGNAQLHFWVNRTSLRVDTILSHAERVSPEITSISFELEPQYEGTFFCGEGGRESNKIGPFAVNPLLVAANVEENRTITIHEFGGNVTLLSRTQLGALWQAYNVTWLLDGNPVVPSEHYKIDFTHDLLPKLTLSDIQQSHLGAYACIVSVTNPYDEKVWRVTSHFSLSAKSSNGWIRPAIIIGAAVLAVVILAPIFTALLCRCCSARKKDARKKDARKKAPRKKKKVTRVKVARKKAVNRSQENAFTMSDRNNSQLTSPKNSTGKELVNSSNSPKNSTWQEAVEFVREQADHSVEQVSPPISDWQWLNDQGSYSNYSNNISRTLTSAFQSEPEGSVQIEINSSQYCVNFAKMVQTNQTTGHSRPVKTNLTVNVQWMYKEGQTFHPYTEQQSKALESMYQQKCPDPLRINEKQYTFDFSRMCQTNASTQYTRPIKRKVTGKTMANTTTDIGKVVSVKNGDVDNMEYPENWVPQRNSTEQFPLQEGSSEWQRVSSQFSSTMAGRKINSIKRIQNKLIWEKYAAHKLHMKRKNDGRVNEKELFHGTRLANPKDIYAGEDGFDMRYSNDGMWGKANYFAVDASYSDSYAYVINGQNPKTKQIFLAKVLTGDSYECQPDGSLKMPPTKSGSHEHTQIKYDTVTGYTQNCRVYMTYDNQKAYPAYLITYETH